jgi:hypothetical protein
VANRPRYRREDLFLVRLAPRPGPVGGGPSGWHGKVQRAIDGESHPFQSLEELLTVLQQMVSRPEKAANDE